HTASPPDPTPPTPHPHHPPPPPPHHPPPPPPPPHDPGRISAHGSFHLYDPSETMGPCSKKKLQPS
ncbi:hypothetical protein, partial [Bifidobacterium sp.]|uniref:hypothetical protein n=1 Tax=Bifidobacterium sp. TaxID=41200 RepID=UPI0039EB99FC